MRWGGAAFGIAITFASAGAFGAQPVDESVDALQKQLHDDYATLSTQDCVTACKALASIRRAADRICALEPGPRCVDARAKADDAQRRVQAACPDCQLAAAPPKDEERRATAVPGAAEQSKPAMAKNAPEHQGGCASCNTPGERPTGDLGMFLLAALVVARRLRARSRSVSR
jgi:hypothetical protein